MLCFRAAAALGLAALVVQAQRLPANAATASLAASSYITFGMAGIAAGETARVNALNVSAPGGPIIAGSSCQVTVTFLDESGKTLAASTQAVSQGQAVHFDLTRSQADAGADPVEIRATVMASFVVSSTVSATAAASCSVLPTMDIFDQGTGRTVTHLETTHAFPTVTPLAVTQN